MKKSVVLLLISIASSACGGDAGRSKTLEAERDQARAELEKVRTEAAAERSFISETTQVLNEVQDAITKIRRNELKITRVTARLGTEGVVKETQKQEMLRDIKDIEKALKDNEAKLAAIEQKYQGGSVASQAAGLKTLITQLKETLQEQQRDTQEMKRVVDDLRAAIRKKDEEIRRKEDALVEKEEQIQTIQEETRTIQEEARAGYVLVGPAEKLQHAGIADSKRGGFLGMRRQWQLGKDLDKSFFQRIDTGTLRELPIPFPKKKIEILSPHASSSYSLEENGAETVLRIKDPKGFWQFRFLVVLTKP